MISVLKFHTTLSALLCLHIHSTDELFVGQIFQKKIISFWFLVLLWRLCGRVNFFLVCEQIYYQQIRLQSKNNESILLNFGSRCCIMDGRYFVFPNNGTKMENTRNNSFLKFSIFFFCVSVRNYRKDILILPGLRNDQIFITFW